MKKITITHFAHFYLKEVPEHLRDTPEKAVESLILRNDASSTWATAWSDWGTLLHVEKITVTFDMPDQVKVEVDYLKQKISSLQAKAEVEIKACLDRINDLMMIGFDAGSVKVIDEGKATGTETSDAE